MQTRALVIAVAAIAILVPRQCQAATRTFTGSGTGTDGHSLGAEAQFDLNGSQLQVTLANSSTTAVKVPSDILTGLFWDIDTTTSPDVQKHMAILTTGNVVVHCSTQPSGGNVGGEWAFRNDISLASCDLPQYGVSASGLGVFGPSDRFDTSANLSGPASVGGMDYGLISAGGISSSANKPVRTQPFIDHSLLLTFQVEPYTFTLDDIKNVRFQYGTALDEPSVSGYAEAPEPGTFGILGLAVAPLLARCRRRRRSP